jgi:hypothetical protein
MIVQSPKRTEWLSYYSSIDHDLEVFLSEHLAPLVVEERRAGRLKRFFFIRYTEETLQLRMRFLPACSEWAAWIDGRLLCAVKDFNERFAAEPRALLKQVLYDRSLYFGETMRSVYSELLNEHTSGFAFRLLHLYSRKRAQLFVVLTFVLHRILSEIMAPGDPLAALAEKSLGFAMKTIADLKLPPFVLDATRATAISSSLLSLSGNARRALQEDPDIRTAVRLLQRVQRLPEGAFVRIHSLHLLANKLGFSLADECLIFTLLKEMASGAPGMKEGEA